MAVVFFWQHWYFLMPAKLICFPGQCTKKSMKWKL